jgi:beta-lactamase regulating signal transducer with metallopeptidase domain
MFLLEIIINYILPAIYTSFVSLVLVLFFLFIFRIKDSNIRILFFFIPLIKPFIIIIAKIGSVSSYLQSNSFIGTLGLFGQESLISSINILEKEPLIVYEINYLILSIISSGIILILLIRTINSMIFYRELDYEERVERKDVPEIFKIIDSFTDKIKLKTPVVRLSHRKYSSPFVAGIKNYTVVLSPNLIESLSFNEAETLIQHELSHIKRKDNITGWIASVLKDALFFNPFAYIAYQLIREEQEKDSDKLVVRYSGKSKKEISRIILKIILKIKSKHGPNHSPEVKRSPAILPLYLFNHIKIKNRINSICRTNPDRIYSRLFPKILMFASFIFILLLQVTFIFKINDCIVFLR